jgi:hypothetical protein
VNQAQEGLDYGLNEARDPMNNPALTDLLGTVNRRLSQQFTDPGGPLAQIRDQQLQAGQYGGTRQGIGEGIATARFGEILGDTSAQIVNNAYNTGQDTFIKSLGLAPQTLQLGALPATQLGAVGAQNENQAAIQEQYEASGRYFDLNSPFTALQNYANIVNGTVSPGQISTGQSGVGVVVAAESEEYCPVVLVELQQELPSAEVILTQLPLAQVSEFLEVYLANRRLVWMEDLEEEKAEVGVEAKKVEEASVSVES